MVAFRFRAAIFFSLFALLSAKKVLIKREGIPPIENVPSTRAEAPSWGWFEQRVDHYNPFDERTWQMRYLYSNQHFQNGGPIFIYLGGEWTISPNSLMTGQIFDLSEEHNGYMFYTEHRFYGESAPLEDYSTESLRYLTTDQALEDVAHFIAYQKSLPTFAESKVVVIGGSYSATMATWMRKKYPHLVDIAYSSSAPLRAVADFYEYLEVVNKAIGEADEECLEIIREAVQDTESLLETPEGVAQALQDFNICDPIDITVEPERSYFFGTFTWTFSGIVQYAESTTIPNVCNAIKSAHTGTSYEKLTTWLRNYYGDCLGSYTDFVEYLNQTAVTDDASRQWYYQTCTEYGFFQSTTSEEQPFGQTVPVDFYYDWCFDLYGIDNATGILDKGVHRTNLIYGSTEPSITQVISVHGSIDPWHALGILEDVNDAAPVIVVAGASHCKDLSSANAATDSEEMYAAKVRVKEVIGAWLRGEGEVTDGTSDGTSEGTTEGTTGGTTEGSTGGTSSTVDGGEGDGVAGVGASGVVVAVGVVMGMVFG